jgi:signal transduction histidine kinase
VVRESLYAAYQSADRLAESIFLGGIVLGAALSLSAAILTRLALRRLTAIAQSADALRLQQVEDFAEVGGRDEVARISRSLSSLFSSLKASYRELAELNQNLEQRVTERTREVQRLSEEMRSAAITRDRLRLSRDLHDTLAHSMLAMLTQIRLIRKLFKMRPEQVEAELAHAEEAAVEGLAKAREAVTELRYFAVRDDGLEQALRRLVARLKERVEIEVSIEVDPAAASLAGPKAETVYRVAEEALHNIEKYAHSTHAAIKVKLDTLMPAHPKLCLLVEDNGDGFDPQSSKDGHFGLIGMHEQADAVGGSLLINSAPSQGTRIKFDVPL